MNSHLKANIEKIISQTSQSKLKKIYNVLKSHSKNSLVKEILIMINHKLKLIAKKRRRNIFTYLTISPIDCDGVIYQDIKLCFEFEEQLNYWGVFSILQLELDIRNLEFIEYPPTFRAKYNTARDVKVGEIFEKKGSYWLKIKYEPLIDEDSKSKDSDNFQEEPCLTNLIIEENKSEFSKTQKNNEEPFITDSFNNQELTDTKKFQVEPFSSNSSILGDPHSYISKLSEFSELVFNLDNCNINSSISFKLIDSKLEKSEKGYINSHQRELLESHEENKHDEAMIVSETETILKEQESMIKSSDDNNSII